MGLTLAITGATGFVGGHTLAEAQRSGHAVRALARRPQPPRDGVAWIAGDLEAAGALAELVRGADAIIHIAGITNAKTPADFIAGNVRGTAFLRRAAGTVPLVLVSSLSARAPQLSRYGASKRQGEDIARGSAGPVTILRPPALYGPGDLEFLELMRTARSGLVPLPRAARTAMLYGPDFARALVAVAEDLAGPGTSAGGLYEIDDGAGAYTPAAIAEAVAGAIGRPCRPLELPPALLGLAAAAETGLARLGGRLPRLSRDRARYMAHPDWSADSAPFRALGLWQPETGLAAGMAATGIWYRAQGLLP